jgi:hypothetical protein
MGDGGQRKSDDQRDPAALSKGHDEPTNGPPMLDELEDDPLGGSHPPHHRPRGRPQPYIKDVAFGIELGEVGDLEWRPGLADVGYHDFIVWIATADHDPAGVQESRA